MDAGTASAVKDYSKRIGGNSQAEIFKSIIKAARTLLKASTASSRLEVTEINIRNVNAIMPWL